MTKYYTRITLRESRVSGPRSSHCGFTLNTSHTLNLNTHRLQDSTLFTAIRALTITEAVAGSTMKFRSAIKEKHKKHKTCSQRRAAEPSKQRMSGDGGGDGGECGYQKTQEANSKGLHGATTAEPRVCGSVPSTPASRICHGDGGSAGVAE